MELSELLARQTADAYEWTNKIMDSVPEKDWDRTPETIDSNISWQVGHLIVSSYYHAIMTTVGHQKDILEKVSMREYSALYGYESIPAKAVGKTAADRLQIDLHLIQERSLDVIRSLKPEDLNQALEPTRIPHPVATTKMEALDWNIKHTMWHCGQLAILKRMVGERWDFGLKKD